VLMIESLRMKIMEVHMQEVAASCGIPCMHAIAVFNMLGRSFYDHCSKFFRIKSYQLSYSGMMFPIPGMDNEDFSAGANIIQVHPVLTNNI
jgi:hypothetical protein